MMSAPRPSPSRALQYWPQLWTACSALRVKSRQSGKKLMVAASVAVDESTVLLWIGLQQA